MNLTKVLYDLTARVIPSKFPQGVPYSTLAVEIANRHNVTGKVAKSGLSLLSELNHINIEGGRVSVNPRCWVRTTDDQLVLCGARGPSLKEHLENENLITPEVLDFDQFNFEMLILKTNDELETKLIEKFGPTTDYPTCYGIISKEINLNDWIDSLTWGNFTGDQYSSQHGITKQFDIQDQAMREVSDQRLPLEMIEQGTGWFRTWRLFKKDDEGLKAVNLETLNDSRLGKLYVNRHNKTIPFYWDGKCLHIPKFLKLPFGVMRAIQTASMKPPMEGWISVSNQKAIKSLVYSGINEKLIKLIGDKIVGEE